MIGELVMKRCNFKIRGYQLNYSWIVIVRRQLTANSGDCNNSDIALRSKPLTGSFSGLPYDYVRIICTDDGEELLALV